MMLPPNAEDNAKKWGYRAKVAALLVIGFVAVPFIGLAFYGLIMLTIAFAVGALIIGFLPVFERLVANWKLMLIKKEAAKHPIETLQNIYLYRQKVLVDKGKAIEVFDGKVRTFGDKCDTLRAKYPAEAKKYDEQLSNMQTMLRLQKAKYKEAKAGLNSFNAQIDKAKDLWDMSQAAQAANTGSGNIMDDFYNKVATETSLDAVSDSVNQSFAQLDTLMMDNDAPEPEHLALPEPVTTIPFQLPENKVKHNIKL